MAVEWMDNFSQYGDEAAGGLATMRDGPWAETTTNTYATIRTDPDGVSGGLVAGFDSGQTDYVRTFRRVFPSGAQTTAGIGFRSWVSQLPIETFSAPSWSFRDASNNHQVGFDIDTTGTIRVYRGAPYSGTLLATTSIPVVTAAAWSHIECKVVIDDSAGEVEVRVNGVPVIELTGVDTKATSLTEVSQIGFMGSNTANNQSYGAWYWKDMICWNGTGTENNDFLGAVQIVTLTPDGDSSFNWNASTGSTGYDLIDETTTGPDDADYISAADPPPAASVFTLSDLDPDVVTIVALQPTARMLKTDGGTANVQMTLTTNGSDDAGADRPITVSATYWWDISELSPDTGLSWTPTEVDNATLKLDRTV